MIQHKSNILFFSKNEGSNMPQIRIFEAKFRDYPLVILQIYLETFSLSFNTYVYTPILLLVKSFCIKICFVCLEYQGYIQVICKSSCSTVLVLINCHPKEARSCSNAVIWSRRCSHLWTVTFILFPGVIVNLSRETTSWFFFIYKTAFISTRLSGRRSRRF